MFYHPTKCPDCAHKSPFGKVKCVKCHRRLYSDDLKPIHTKDPFAKRTYRMRVNRHDRQLAVLKAKQSPLSRISSLTTIGSSFLSVTIFIVKELRQIRKDLAYVLKVLFKPPPKDDD